ncbi:hypothetical protein [Alkalilimnicola ehrlichii]|uniref:hypothetical protein n=1 Tax=Alkalilimnicola ehrlichii TaxID=351052 RepID=UPI00384AD7F3
MPGLPSPHSTADLLNSLGLSVEGIDEIPAAPASVVVAEVQSFRPLEQNPTLFEVCVSDGSRSRSVVCGAPGLYVNMRTALALPGAVLPGGAEAVKSQSIAGLHSEGMLCSPKELGLYDYSGAWLSSRTMRRPERSLPSFGRLRRCLN